MANGYTDGQKDLNVVLIEAEQHIRQCSKMVQDISQKAAQLAALTPKSKNREANYNAMLVESNMTLHAQNFAVSALLMTIIRKQQLMLNNVQNQADDLQKQLNKR